MDDHESSGERDAVRGTYGLLNLAGWQKLLPNSICLSSLLPVSPLLEGKVRPLPPIFRVRLRVPAAKR